MAFSPAPLLPHSMTWLCPCCGHQEVVELVEDDAGQFSAPLQDRYVRCPACEAGVDIGWAGWRPLGGVTP